MSNIKFSQLPDLATITPATIIPVVSGGLNYTVTSANLQAYVNGGNGNITSGNITATGNVTGGNIITTGVVSAAGNIRGGNINTAGSISAGGNITGNYLFGNISTATGGYSNANVQAVLQTYNGSLTAGTVSATGNITGNFFLGNGSQLTGLPQSYTNANVAAFLPTYTGNIAAGNVSATGNVTAAFFVGNGSALTGIATTGNFVDLTTNQTIGGNKTFTGTTTLNPYIETTNDVGNTSTSFTPTMSNGPIQKVVANNNFILQAPSGMVSGQSITLIVRQDNLGNRVMSPNNAYRWAGGNKTLSTAANSIDMILIFYDGTNYLATLNKGFIQ